MFFLSQHNVALIPNLLVNDKPFSHSRHKRLIVLVAGKPSSFGNMLSIVEVVPFHL